MPKFEEFIKGFEEPKIIKGRYSAIPYSDSDVMTGGEKLFDDKDEALEFVKSEYAKGKNWVLGDGYNDDGSERGESDILFDYKTQREKDEYEKAMENDTPWFPY
jgi:hypothetical protein